MPLTESCNSFLGFLRTCTPEDFRGSRVEEYLRGHPISAPDFAPFHFFRDDCYGRNLVVRNECFELLVLTWLPKQRTPIHDHASQRCWMMITQGKLAMRNYAPYIDGAHEVTPLGGAQTHSAGEAVYIDDMIAMHSIANASSEPAVSIHLYAGPVPRCRIYDEAARDFAWKELCYFTIPGEGRANHLSALRL